MQDTVKNPHILGSLSKATFIELFFDLVFIVCMRSITPVLTSVEGDVVGWYECYTFVFCFVLMIQIWFSSTVLMNRMGSSSFKDAPCLLTNMFFLFLMTRGISTTWEHYAQFNVLWILMNANLILHWCLRFRKLPPEAARANKSFVRRVVVVHAVVIVLILVSFLFESAPAQVCCLLALLAGFVSWPSLRPLSEAGCEHLAERCALFLILAFGETFVGLSGAVTETVESVGAVSGVAVTVYYFLIIVGMFMVYLVHLEKKLDASKLGSGSRYMAVTTLLAFCIMAITATFELGIEGKQLWFMAITDVFPLMASIYLFAFFLFIPFVKPRARSGKGWVIGRVIACALPAGMNFVSYAFVTIAEQIDSMSMVSLLATFFALIATLLGFVFSTLIVFVIDYKAYTPKREKKPKKQTALQKPEEIGESEGSRDSEESKTSQEPETSLSSEAFGLGTGE